MASDTATAATRGAAGGSGGSVEAASILTRLTPDDLHPARLAGPHAWHPWGLSVTPPSDRHVRLLLPPGTRPDTADRILHKLERQLARTPWPPAEPLTIQRHDKRLDCHDNHRRRSLIEITPAPDSHDRTQTEIVTRDGWPILGELATLNDRIASIDPDQPSPTDLADLASWVEHKMAEPDGRHRLDTPLPHLLAAQTRDHPAAADRLRTILTQRRTTAGHPRQVLAYLADQLDHSRISGHARRR